LEEAINLQKGRLFDAYDDINNSTPFLLLIIVLTDSL